MEEIFVDMDLIFQTVEKSIVPDSDPLGKQKVKSGEGARSRVTELFVLPIRLSIAYQFCFGKPRGNSLSEISWPVFKLKLSNWFLPNQYSFAEKFVFVRDGAREGGRGERTKKSKKITKKNSIGSG